MYIFDHYLFETIKSTIKIIINVFFFFYIIINSHLLNIYNLYYIMYNMSKLDGGVAVMGRRKENLTVMLPLHEY